MARKGYDAEYRCKKENEKIFGIGNCIKVAIGGSSDYIIINQGKLLKFIEVKETKKNKYYPHEREKKQFAEVIRLAKQHKVPCELWIYFKKGPGKPIVKTIKVLYEPNEN